MYLKDVSVPRHTLENGGSETAPVHPTGTGRTQVHVVSPISLRLVRGISLMKHFRFLARQDVKLKNQHHHL
jgi:hypothetical protein